MTRMTTNLLDLNTVALKLLIPRCVSVDVVNPINQLYLQAYSTSANILNRPHIEHALFSPNGLPVASVHWCSCNHHYTTVFKFSTLIGWEVMINNSSYILYIALIVKMYKKKSQVYIQLTQIVIKKNVSCYLKMLMLIIMLILKEL